MNYVEFEEVVAEAMMSIGSDDEVAKNFSRQWIHRALQRLGMTEITEVTKIEAKNFLLKKPKNFRKLEDIALYDANDNLLPHAFHGGKTRIYPNVESVNYDVVINEGTADEETVTYTTPIDLSESDTSFVIGTNGDDVSYAMVRYHANPIDSTGLPKVREDEVEACVAFVRWRWSQRKNENQSEIAQNKHDWMQAADWVIANKKSIDNSNESKKSQAKQLNRFLPNFNRSSF